MPTLHAAPLARQTPNDIQRHWSSVRNREQLDALLSDQGLTRLEALRVAEPGYAIPIDASGVEQLLRMAAQAELPLRLQWQTPAQQAQARESRGCVRGVQATAHGLRADLGGRVLHLCSENLSRAWVVRHPTALGLSCTLELFDAQERPLLVLSGECCTLPSHACADPTEEARCTRTWRRIVSVLVCDSVCSGAC